MLLEIVLLLEKGVVEEQENMKDIQAFKTADRDKQVKITIAEANAQEDLISNYKAAEAQKQAAINKQKKLILKL